MAQFVFSRWLEDFLAGPFLRFEWDEGNSKKSLEKHGIGILETEQAFYDQKRVCLGKQVFPVFDEDRYAFIGRGEGELLFICFTLRGARIRVISARKANKKERKIYE